MMVNFWCLSVILVCLWSGYGYSQTAANLDVTEEKKILVVGDSLSAAYKLSSSKGWVTLLEQRLRSNDYPYRVINASVSGATTAAGLPIMKDALARHRPDIVLLELGANDGLQGKPIAYISKNLEALIAMAQTEDAEVVLLGVRLPPNFGRRYTEPFSQQFATLAGSYKLSHVPFLLDGVAGSSSLMMEDGFHPNAIAQPLILENVWSVLQAVLAK